MKESNNGVKCGVPIEKIAYHVQDIYKKEASMGKTILIIKSNFCDEDIKRFAEKYHKHSSDNDVRHIANMLHLTR